MKKKYNFYTIALSIIIILMLIGFYCLPTLQTAPSKMIDEPAYADGFMENVVAMRMNTEGLPESTLYSPKLTHFAQNNSTRLTAPHFTILPNKGNAWNISAEHGVSTDGIKTLYLWGNVKMHQIKGPFNKDVTLLTSSITIYPEQNTAVTDQPVTLLQDSNVLNAIGLKTNFKTSTIELLSQSRGVYDPGM